jgi:hypothetical protein
LAIKNYEIKNVLKVLYIFLATYLNNVIIH